MGLPSVWADLVPADLCNTHLPLGTGATHGVGEETHVVGVDGARSGWLLGKVGTGSGGGASAEESGPDHLVSLGLLLLLPDAAQPSPSSGSGTPWHPQYC